MTSMRIDGDKSAKVWARRLQYLVETAEADGVAFIVSESESLVIKDVVVAYKDGSTALVDFKIWGDE